MRLIRNDRSLLFWSVLSLLALLLADSNVRHAKAYPMMMEIAEEDEKCIRLNIPEDDDAHMVFVIYPSNAYGSNDGGSSSKLSQAYDPLENYLFDQMQEITKRRTKNAGLLRKFPAKPPPEVQSAMDDFLRSFQGNMKTPLKVTLTNPKSTNHRSMDTYWFTPLVINHVRRAIRTPKKDRESSPLEGYMACFDNDDEEYPLHVVVDSVYVGEGPEYDDDENASEDPTFSGDHLTPLAEQLQESIESARTVVREMQYMERREARMRHTADSINARVRYFSYVSVGILLLVTYVQVTYLKRYFRKKKLL